MKKIKTKFLAFSLIVFFFSTHQASAQEQTSYSWSDQINEGDQYSWKIDILVDNTEYHNNYNSTFSPLQANTTNYEANGTMSTTPIASTTTITKTVDVETTTGVGGFGTDIQEGSKISITVLKDPTSIKLNSPLFDVDDLSQHPSLFEYFEFSYDGLSNYELFPVYVMIVPTVVRNGQTDNFFENEILAQDGGEFDIEGAKWIENDIFYLQVSESEEYDLSSYEFSAEVRWDTKTGVLLYFDQMQINREEYFTNTNQLRLNLQDNNHIQSNSELELPISFYFVYGIILIPIVRKVKN